jgi:hypothetical protein
MDDRVVVASPAYKGLAPSQTSARYIGLHTEGIGTVSEDALGFVSSANMVGIKMGGKPNPSEPLAKQFQPEYKGTILQRQAGRLPHMQMTGF